MNVCCLGKSVRNSLLYAGCSVKLGFSKRSFSSIILGIETSCDDTFVALIDGDNRSVIHHLKVSQTEIHQKSDGIVPVNAGKEHKKILPRLVERLFEESEMLWSRWD